MSSNAQISANQLNAKSSTGPSTPEGKVNTSHNATTHGLAGSFCLLPHEDRTEFERLLDSYAKSFQPVDDHESYLVEMMVQSRWKTARLHRLEAAILTQMSAQTPSATDPDAMLAAAMLKGSANAYVQVQRYLAAAERSYFKALRQLENEKEERQRLEQIEIFNASSLQQRFQRYVQNEANIFGRTPNSDPSAAQATTPTTPVAAVRTDTNPRR